MKLSLKSTTTETSSKPSVIGLPGPAFFCRRFDLPAGMEAAEVPGFVELQLEELSPFPLEQLYFGHIVSTDRSMVFVYAAYKRRFPAEQTDTWKHAAFVIPDFVPAARLKFDGQTIVFLRSALSISALFFEPGRELPARVASLPVAEDASSREIDDVRKKLSEQIGVSTAEEVSRRIAANPEERSKGRMFVIESEDVGEPWEVLVPGAERWTMDVRDSAFLAEKRRRLGYDVVLWRVLQGVAALLVFLIVGEVLLLGARGISALYESRINSRAALASSLEDHDSVALRIREFELGDLHPFEMLNLLAANMPDNLAFTTATAVGRNTLEVLATALSVSDINTYRSRLGNVPEIEKVEISDERTRPEGTTFKAIIVFRAGAYGPPDAGGES